MSTDLGSLALSGRVNVQALYDMFRDAAPSLDRAVSLCMGKARQRIALGAEVARRGAPLTAKRIGDLAHYFDPDGLGLWEDMGALTGDMLTLAEWVEQ